MPIFEYKCSDCGEKFEVLHGVGKTENRSVKCPSCGKMDVKKLISSSYLKGSGSGTCSTCSSPSCSSCSPSG